MMADISYEDEILASIRLLDEAGQRRVLEFIRGLSRPKGEPGWKIVQHARKINISSKDLDEMRQAIEEACEIIEDFPEVNLDE